MEKSENSSNGISRLYDDSREIAHDATYGAESAAYRTAGVIDEAIHESDEDLMKKMSQFAIECALNKVNASETLAYIVDEAVQIHGGYGYMQEYEVERLYRDARISRILKERTKLID